MVLVGDVGGTKTILALFDRTDSGWECRHRQKYASHDFPDFTALLKVFLEEGGANIDAVCIGVAGPIVNGNCETTNLPWVLIRSDIADVTKARHTWLLNDLEASAWGLPTLPDTDFVELNPNGVALKEGHSAVVAAGTGLGEAIMVRVNKDDYQVVAGEGGHADYAPCDQEQIGLLSYLMEKYQGHVSYERVLSGHGLVNIYDYLKESQYAPVQASIEKQMLDHDPAEIIGTSGVEGSDELCQHALTIFCRIYGAEAGNLALKCLPFGGMYLAGGIAGKILPALTNGEFVKYFLDKGRSAHVLQTISVKACTNPDTALLGALHYLQRQL